MVKQSAQKDWLILPVHNHPTLNRWTRKKLLRRKLMTVGDVVKICLTKDGYFIPIRSRGFGTAINYDIAKLLYRTGFLTKDKLAKVSTPDWVLRKPTDKEIGAAGKKLISKFTWSEAAHIVIKHTCNIGNRGLPCTPRLRTWKGITVGDVVKRFIRMNNEGKPYFWRTGHLGSHWYSRDEALIDALQECLPEIERFLYDNHFLETTTKPEKEEP